MEFKVIQGHRSWCQSKAHVRLPIISLIVTLAVSATVFEILTLKARKSLNFFDRPCLRPPFGGNPLEFGDEIWRQKTRVLRLSDGEEIMSLAFFILTQYRRVTDGRSDGRTRCCAYYPR